MAKLNSTHQLASRYDYHFSLELKGRNVKDIPLKSQTAFVASTQGECSYGDHGLFIHHNHVLTECCRNPFSFKAPGCTIIGYSSGPLKGLETKHP